MFCGLSLGIVANQGGDIVYVNTVNRNKVSVHDLMGSPTKKGKYIFINKATIGCIDANYALRTGSFPAGSELTIINEGYILGYPGAAGTGGAGGAGGNCLYMDYPLTLDNTSGYIYSGGGGGGRGGNGGQGYYNTTIRQPASGYQPLDSGTYWQISSSGYTSISWGYALVYGALGTPTAVTVGAYTYHRGPAIGTTYEDATKFQLWRTYVTPIYTTGGDGGAGGRGQGFNTSSTSGIAGSAGQTNAGTGGTGGTGGSWGTSGNTGNTGGSGNYTGGIVGSIGGPPGYAVLKNGHGFSLINPTPARILGPIA